MASKTARPFEPAAPTSSKTDHASMCAIAQQRRATTRPLIRHSASVGRWRTPIPDAESRHRRSGQRLPRSAARPTESRDLGIVVGATTRIAPEFSCKLLPPARPYTRLSNRPGCSFLGPWRRSGLRGRYLRQRPRPAMHVEKVDIPGIAAKAKDFGGAKRASRRTVDLRRLAIFSSFVVPVVIVGMVFYPS